MRIIRVNSGESSRGIVIFGFCVALNHSDSLWTRDCNSDPASRFLKTTCLLRRSPVVPKTTTIRKRQTARRDQIAQQVLSTAPEAAGFDLPAELSFCVSVNFSYKRLFYIEMQSKVSTPGAGEKSILVIITGPDESLFNHSLVFDTIPAPWPGPQSG